MAIHPHSSEAREQIDRLRRDLFWLQVATVLGTFAACGTAVGALLLWGAQ